MDAVAVLRFVYNGIEAARLVWVLCFLNGIKWLVMRMRMIVFCMISTGVHLFGQMHHKKTGAWYMFFWDVPFQQARFGLQGDIQYRNWNYIGDLEQLLLRGGVYYQPQSADVRLSLGYAYIAMGTPGESSATTEEHRIYQEALLPQKVGTRLFAKHRFRYEQRFVEGQSFRTRYRYALFLTLPINAPNLDKGALYIAVYNEIFLNGQKDVGNQQRVEYFDANRLYGAIGYALTNRLKIQLGYMQQTKNNVSKGQIQLSIHSKF